MLPCIICFFIHCFAVKVRIFSYNGGHSKEVYHTKRMQRYSSENLEDKFSLILMFSLIGRIFFALVLYNCDAFPGCSVLNLVVMARMCFLVVMIQMSVYGRRRHLSNLVWYVLSSLVFT